MHLEVGREPLDSAGPVIGTLLEEQHLLVDKLAGFPVGAHFGLLDGLLTLDHPVKLAHLSKFAVPASPRPCVFTPAWPMPPAQGGRNADAVMF